MRMTIAVPLFIIVMLLLSGCQPIQAPPETQAEVVPTLIPMVIESADEVPRIALDEAKQHFDNGTAIFVDARYEEEYGQAHIADAISLPDSATLFIGDNLVEALENLENGLPKDQLIITYCT